jgi:hypothetical protein
MKRRPASLPSVNSKPTRAPQWPWRRHAYARSPLAGFSVQKYLIDFTQRNSFPRRQFRQRRYRRNIVLTGATAERRHSKGSIARGKNLASTQEIEYYFYRY